MKKITMIPIILAATSIILFVAIILRYEHHLGQAQSIYAELKPVDPRSLLQGDYMVLNYDLNLHDMSEQDIKNKSSLIGYVYLDAHRRIIKTNLDFTRFNEGEKAIKLVLKNPNNQLDSLYPAANSFLFSEGLATCYNDAEYAHLRVNSNGKALLVGLVDQNLKSLQCEQLKNWANDHIQ